MDFRMPHYASQCKRPGKILSSRRRRICRETGLWWIAHFRMGVVVGLNITKLNESAYGPWIVVVECYAVADVFLENGQLLRTVYTDSTSGQLTSQRFSLIALKKRDSLARTSRCTRQLYPESRIVKSGATSNI